MKHRPELMEAKLDSEVLDEIAKEWVAESGVRVEKRRRDVNLHRRELADLAGTTEPTIIRIESGTLNPRDSLRMAIAAALCCEVSDLWTYPRCEQLHARAAA